MTALFKTTGATLAFLAAALVTRGARAGDASTAPCRELGRAARARDYPTDTDATSLWMHRCSITELNPNDVANLPNVERISLHSNGLTHIDLSVFRTAPRLTQLQLQDNKIRDLSTLSEDSCPMLTILVLRHNLITTIHDSKTFSACSKLKHLELSYNQITYIHPGTFRQLTELTNLFLYSNKLTYVTEEMFASNKKLFQLELYDNRLTYLPPKFVTNLKWAGVGLKYFYFDSNPWPCACLLELLEDVKRAGVNRYKKSPNVKITHYDGSLAECIYRGEYPCRPVPSGLLGPGE